MKSSFERLTNNQWEFIKYFFDYQRKRTLDLREVFDAILYVTRTGIQWRNLKETKFPDWQAVYYYFDKWKNNGIIKMVNLTLNRLERLQNGREAFPSLGLVDSQSIKLAPMIGQNRGIDGNKKVNGRKRHILVDVTGRTYEAHVHAANLHDSPNGVNLLKPKAAHFERLEKILGDKTYRGTFARAVEEIGLKFEIPVRPESTKGFAVEAKRWVVERSFAWMNFFRRIVIDHEKTVESSVSFVYLANISMCISKINFKTK